MGFQIGVREILDPVNIFEVKLLKSENFSMCHLTIMAQISLLRLLEGWSLTMFGAANKFRSFHVVIIKFILTIVGV